MLELFRSLVIHQARFHKTFLESWGEPGADRIDVALDSLVHDVLWLTKLPLLWTPTFALKALDTLTKTWPGSSREPAEVQAAAAVIADLRPRVDADTLRFILKLKPEDLETRVELFFGGRAMNKPLWQYLTAWLEHGAVLRGRLSGPGMFETSFS